jgi:predicted SAM-dependent methyltransferase
MATGVIGMNLVERFFRARQANPVQEAATPTAQTPERVVPQFRRLQLASGYNLIPDWINTDLLPLDGTTFLDFTKPFPYADESFDAVFCEHSIEHISTDDARLMCREVYRVLRRGGHFRVVTPELEKIAAMALHEDSPDVQAYIEWYRDWNKKPDATVSDAVNAMFYMHGHQHLYMRAELAGLLKSAGFADMRFFEAGEYGQPVFNGVDGHGKVIGEKINAMEAFAVETSKA